MMDVAEIRQNLKDRFWEIREQYVDWLLDQDWPEPAISIRTVADYARACSLYSEMNESVGKDEWGSPAALCLLAALGVNMRSSDFKPTMRKRSVALYPRTIKPGGSRGGCLDTMSGGAPSLAPSVILWRSVALRIAGEGVLIGWDGLRLCMWRGVVVAAKRSAPGRLRSFHGIGIGPSNGHYQDQR
jgi:hypothetical protein